MAELALVDLGTLELERLGRPAAALGRFRRYIASNRAGALEAEAMWGEANALRALGRPTEERVALTALVTAHPDALQSIEARERLEER